MEYASSQKGLIWSYATINCHQDVKLVKLHHNQNTIKIAWMQQYMAYTRIPKDVRDEREKRKKKMQTATCALLFFRNIKIGSK